MKTNCPVCNYSDLTDDIKICPECKSDLEVFDLITKSKRALKNRQIWLVIFAICLIAGVATGAYLVYRAYDAVEWRDDKISRLENQNRELLAKVEIQAKEKTIETDVELIAEEKKLKEPKEKTPKTEEDKKPIKEYIVYIVLPGDCLWNIAQKFYDDGMKYVKIAADNNLSDVNIILEGEELKIFEN